MYRRRRDHSTWYDAARGVRKTLHRMCRYLVNPGNADDTKRSGNSIWKQFANRFKVRSWIFSSELTRKCSHKAEGNLCMVQLQNQRDQRALSDSKSSGQLVQGATPRPQFQNMKYMNHQNMTKIFQFLQKEVVNCSKLLEFSSWKHKKQMC